MALSRQCPAVTRPLKRASSLPSARRCACDRRGAGHPGGFDCWSAAGQPTVRGCALVSEMGGRRWRKVKRGATARPRSPRPTRGRPSRRPALRRARSSNRSPAGRKRRLRNRRWISESRGLYRPCLRASLPRDPQRLSDDEDHDPAHDIGPPWLWCRSDRRRGLAVDQLERRDQTTLVHGRFGLEAVATIIVRIFAALVL